MLDRDILRVKRVVLERLASVEDNWGVAGGPTCYAVISELREIADVLGIPLAVVEQHTPTFHGGRITRSPPKNIEVSDWDLRSRDVLFLHSEIDGTPTVDDSDTSDVELL